MLLAITTSSFGKWVGSDVLVEPEHVGRVVALLHGDESRVGRRWVRRPDLVGLVVTGEVDVGDVRTRARQRGTSGTCPLDVLVEAGAIRGAHDDVADVSRVAVAEGCRVLRHAGH